MAHVTTCSVVMAASVLVCGSRSWLTATSADVAFQLHQHHLVVAKGSIGALNGLNLLIDTGTIPSVVDARVAAARFAFQRALERRQDDSVRVRHRVPASGGSSRRPLGNGSLAGADRLDARSRSARLPACHRWCAGGAGP
jgi:hypothetical protein